MILNVVFLDGLGQDSIVTSGGSFSDLSACWSVPKLGKTAPLIYRKRDRLVSRPVTSDSKNLCTHAFVLIYRWQLNFLALEFATGFSAIRTSWCCRIYVRNRPRRDLYQSPENHRWISSHDEKKERHCPALLWPSEKCDFVETNLGIKSNKLKKLFYRDTCGVVYQDPSIKTHFVDTLNAIFSVGVQIQHE